MASKKRTSDNRGGRPRKFSEASRPITVTLPERTLRLLESVDEDRAIAIAKTTDWATKGHDKRSSSVEIIEIEKGRAVIVVGPSKYLKRLSWLRLVEIAPTRYLLVIPPGTAIETLEVAIMDMLDASKRDDVYERQLLSDLKSCLTLQRRSKKVSKAELLLLDVEK